MRKKLLKTAAPLIALIICFSVMAPPAGAAPEDIPPILRIGIQKLENKSEITITSRTLTVGYEAGASFYHCGVVTASSGFSIVPVNLYYVRISQAYQTVVDCLSAVNSYRSAGYKAMACLADFNSWVVYLGGYPSEADARAIQNGVSGETILMPPSSSRIALLDGGNGFLVFENKSLNVQFSGGNGAFIELNGRKYRNRVEFARYTGNSGVTAVSVCTMQEYLYSVVPSEMPTLWHIEAQKAQACAARTYAITRYGVHSGSGYDLCDDDHCQVYTGTAKEAVQTNLAVDMTRDLLIMYDGKPINAVFFSSSGGATDDSENVWTQTVSYLRSVADIYDTEGKLWSRTFTKAQISSLLASSNANIGSCEGVEITKQNANGRVLEMKIIGTNGTKTLEKEAVRNFFQTSAGGLLESRFFMLSDGTAAYDTVTAEAVSAVIGAGASFSQELKNLYIMGADGKISTMSSLNNPAAVQFYAGNTAKSSIPFSSTSTTGIKNGLLKCTSDTITFIGRGWGHGVGMSQYGAKGMAEAGFTFDEIIKFYYTGVTIR